MTARSKSMSSYSTDVAHLCGSSCRGARACSIVPKMIITEDSAARTEMSDYEVKCVAPHVNPHLAVDLERFSVDCVEE